MPFLLAKLALFSLLVPTGEQVEWVRVGLFSLFKPQVLHVQVADQTATIDTGSLTLSLDVGEGLRVTLSGSQLHVLLIDRYGRIKQSLNASHLKLTGVGATAFELSIPQKIRRTVRGDLLIAAPTAASTGLRIILSTAFESAVASVTAAEMQGQQQTEAIKALSVIARTYMLANLGRHHDEGFDFCDTTHCQLYRGEQDLSAELAAPLMARAVAATAGEYLAFQNQAVDVYFTAVCGGLSATPEMVWGGASRYPYQRIACDWCKPSEYAHWQRQAAASSVVAALSAATGARLSQNVKLTVEKYANSEVAHAVVLSDRGRQLRLTVEEFRRAVGRKLGWNRVLSPSFEVERRGERFFFRGRGFGSQVGFCLIGSVAQAAAGRGYRDILGFYFPEMTIRTRP